MITRGLIYSGPSNEVKDFSWKMYPLSLGGINKDSLFRFLDSFLVKSDLDAEDNVYIDTTGLDIIIVDNAGAASFGRYNRIYSKGILEIEWEGKCYVWGQVKKNISQIVFMDNLDLHPIARHLWSEKGFSFTRFYAGIDQDVKNEILKEWEKASAATPA